jgi:hypothetical protein
VTQTRPFTGTNTPLETHKFELLEYRYRPMLVWRSFAIGGHAPHSEYTFGSWIIEKLVRTEWCGKGSGVLVEAIAQYDYSESHNARLFYEFGTASFLTTLDHRTTDEELNNALQRCRAE